MAGRGRGYAGQYNPQMAYPQAQNFRPNPPNGRGMPNMPYQGRQQGPYPGSPSLAARSPAIMNANPVTPNMGQVQMMPGQHNGYPPYMGGPQVNRHFLSSDSLAPRGRGRDRGGRAGQRKGRGASNFSSSTLREDGIFGEPHFSRDPASEYYKSPSLPAVAVHVAPLLPPSDLSPESGNFEQFLTMKTQGHVVYQADPSIQAMYQQQWMQQQQQMQGYMPPQSPRPPFAQGPSAPHMQHTYSGQGQPYQQSQPLSRTPSQMSGTDRPNSSLGQPQTSSLVSPSGPPPLNRQTGSPAPKPSFTVPPKKNAAVVIKNAQGDIVSFSKPTPASAHATPSPVKPATPPAAPPTGQAGSTPDPVQSHPDNANTAKINEEKKKELQETFAKKVAEARQDTEDSEKQAVAAKEKEASDAQEAAAKEAEAKDLAAKEAEAKAAQAKEAEAEAARIREAEAKEAEAAKAREAEAAKAKEAEAARAKAEAAAREAQEQEAKKKADAEAEQTGREVPRADKTDEDDEIDYDAIEAEFAAQEAAEEAREAEYQRKKEAEREAQKQREREEEEAFEANMKRMEREAEEREEALLKKRAEGGSDSEGDSKKLFASLRVHGAHSPDSNTSPIIQTPAESGTATPVSDVSMGPPARGKKDRKPAELTLNTSKAVEPPQPSAALKSLQSARFLEDPRSVEYPSTIASPNPALNKNAPADKKFKYDKEFLLQFQSVFKEKPSLDWDARVRETLGDGGESTASARPSSARTPAGMGSRSVSNRPSVVPGSFGQMGTFGAPPRTGPTQLPPGPTSTQRFAMSNPPGPNQRNPMQNPFEAFGRPQGAPLTAASMSRTASANVLGGIPPSPRVGGATRGSTRDGSKRGKQSNRRQEEEDSKMPLTAGMDVGTIKVSQTGWKARSLAGPSLAGPALGGDGLLPPDVVQRKVKSNLNKMTPEKFDKISDQILEIAAQSKDESDGRTLRQVIQLTFEKATDEAHWASMYAMFCKRMLESMSPDIKDENIKDKHGQVVTGGNLFRKYLLNRCQEEFERGWKVNLPPKLEGQTEEAAMLSDEYYIAAAAKRRGLGLVKFIGELYKLGMLTERIMHECVKKLLDYDGMPDEAEIESLTSLLKTVGKDLDDPRSKAQPRMDAYFERMQAIMDMPELPSRLKFMIMVSVLVYPTVVVCPCQNPLANRFCVLLRT
jgi:translation initiation factor 4G